MSTVEEQVAVHLAMKRELTACFVSVTVPEAAWEGIGYDPDKRSSNLEDGLFEIVLDTEQYVWIKATYAEETPKGVVHVGDGRTNGYGMGGARILSVPAEWCKFYDAEEAESIQRCMEADARLLSYAR